MAHKSEAGFGLIETLVVVGLVLTIGAMTVPTITAAMQQYALNHAAESVAATIRSARYAAISKNRTMRVRFNCPASGQMRVVEVVGNAAIDGAADRCSSTAYPYPDVDPAVAPNNDGPVVVLPSGGQFGVFESLEIDALGRVTPQTGCPTCVNSAVPATIELSNGYDTRTITVSTSGQVLAQ
jgi:type II secretory pathway pseudopilin PulG